MAVTTYKTRFTGVPAYQPHHPLVSTSAHIMIMWQAADLYTGELWSTNGLELHVTLDPLKRTFWQTIFQPIGGAAPRKFYTR